MKKLIYIFVAAVLAVGFVGCEKENTLLNEETITTIYSYEDVVAEFSNSLGVDINFEIIEVLDGVSIENESLDFNYESMKRTAIKNNWDIESSSTIKLKTASGVAVTTITTPHADNPNKMSYIVESNGLITSSVVDLNFNEKNNTISYVVDNTTEALISGRIGNWMPCMHKVMDSHVGIVITAGGIAGGLGCFGCAVVAGFLFTVASVGCLG